MTTEYERWADLSDREATGERLTDADREFLERFAREDELARAEAELWDEMANLDTAGDEASAIRIADRAVEVVSKKAPSRTGGTWMWAVGGVVAAAAAGALFIASSRGERPSALLELSLGDVSVAGARVEMGARIGAGKEVTIARGAACLALESKMHACFREGSVVKLSNLGAPQRRLDLVSGRVDVALAPLPQGERFSIVANGTWSTAVGTAYSVEVLANGAVETIVHEGKVRVGGENSGDLVIAHKIGLSQGGVKVEDLGDHARTETADWKALSQVAERSIEAPIPVAETPAADTAEAPASPEPGVATGPAKIEPPRAAPKTIEPPASAAELLALARQALREKRWADAAASYRSIVGTFPSSPEAHTVLVPLANLEVDRLGQAAQGLKHLDAYLSTGGPLVVEARLAKIRAFRSLGRTLDEASAIDEFLAAHPKSLEAESLKQRRQSLGQ
jgi:hypothetical protein